MSSERAAHTVLEHLRGRFGTFLDIRAPERRRRAAGPTWSVPVVAVCSSGDVAIAEVEVDEAGVMSPVIDADHVVRALRARSEPTPRDTLLGEFTEADILFQDLAAEVGEGESDVEASSQRLRELFRTTGHDSLREARTLLPHLLGNTNRRGRVLMMMAEVERRLGEDRLALGYIDAAAQELADRFDMSALERAAAMAFSIVGEAAFVDLPVRGLLHRCQTRLRPIESIFDSPVLALVPPEHREHLAAHAHLGVLAPGETLLSEGAPSTALFVIRSGALAVLHENPTWRLVRCCWPGWLLGESSVLVDVDPRCTATLRAEHVTEVWRIEADVVRSLMVEVPSLRDAIADTKAVHGLDSFFSAHASVGQLDTEVRNEMLKCIHSIRSFDERTVVLPAGEPPVAACLVARGQVSLFDGAATEGTPIGTLSADEFIGVRDSLHRIPPPRTAVAEQGSTVVFFDAERLRDLADRSPGQAVLVLERLG